MMRLVEAPYPVVVTGGRAYADRDRVFEILSELNGIRPISLLGHGACRRKNDPPDKLAGADRWAHEWALDHWIPVIAYPADWEKYGKKAGRVRNNALVDLVQPKCCVAFPGGDGTENMVLICRKHPGCYVLEIDREPATEA